VLKEGIAKFLKLDSLVSHLTGYVEARFELIKYEFKEDASKVLAKAAVYAMVVFAAAFFLLFISVALALWLTAYFGQVGAFATVAGVYLIVVIVILLNKERLSSGIEEKIKVMLKQTKK
jgi:uncharacterized membrane protein YqjE